VRTALSRTQEALDELMGFTDGVSARAARNAAGLTVQGEPVVMATQLPPEYRAGGRELYESRTPASAVESMVVRTAQTIHALTLPLPAQVVEVMKRRLVSAVALGNNPNETARKLVKELRGVYDLSYQRAANITRTETLDAYRRTSALMHQANSDVLAGWTWLAKLDKRTCPTCWSKHGSEYGNDVPGPWDHQQGRCARMPRLKSWKDLGLPGTEPAPAIPDARKVFSGLPEAEQKAIMGTNRLAALNDGSARWQDLAYRRSQDGWRDSFAVRPMSDLIKAGVTDD
jgi:SPP1 gp7 family putative phage head morphogenesis protein